MDEHIKNMKSMETLYGAINYFDSFVTQVLNTYGNIEVSAMFGIKEFETLFLEIQKRKEFSLSPFFMFYNEMAKKKILEASDFGKKVKQLEIDLNVEQKRTAIMQKQFEEAEEKLKNSITSKRTITFENSNLKKTNEALTRNIAKLKQKIAKSKELLNTTHANYRSIFTENKLNTLHNKFVLKSSQSVISDLKNRNDKIMHFLETIIPKQLAKVKFLTLKIQELEAIIKILKKEKMDKPLPFFSNLSRQNLNLIHPELYDSLNECNISSCSLDEKLAVFNMCKELMTEIELSEFAVYINPELQSSDRFDAFVIDPTMQLDINMFKVFADRNGLELNLKCAKQFMYNERYTNFVYTCVDPLFRKANYIFVKEYLRFKGVI